MSFALLPPEVNSGLMYTGPGAGPMAAAGAAWGQLATDLYATAASYQSVVSGLMSGWRGASSISMMSAAAPYVAWMNTTAGVAEQAGAQANAAVAAFEQAFTATVPPALVTANRALLMALVATNFFGQNAPEIAAVEAQYGEMWAQDALAMDTYAVSSSHLTAMTPFSAPTTAANPAMASAAAAPAAASSVSGIASFLSGLTSGLPALLGSLTSASPLAGLSGLLSGTGLSGLLGGLSLPAGLSGILSSPTTATALQGVYWGSIPARFAMYPMSMLSSMASRGAAGAGGLNMEGLATGVNSLINAKLQPVVQTLANQFGAVNRAVLAAFGHAHSMSGLSVPQGWGQLAAPAQELTRAVPVLPHTSLAAPAVNAGGSPLGSPFAQGMMGALSGRGLAGLTAKVGPKIIPRPSAGG